MSSDFGNAFNRESLDTCLKALARLFRKQNGRNASAEIVLVGGAAILLNYGFRQMTLDVDAVIHASSSMKDAINQIGDQYTLPIGWLSADFMRTASYTPKLSQFSQYHATFSGVLQVRSMAAEYLIAMKLMAGRKYKNDLSDILGILAEHEKRGQPIPWARVDQAVCDLYQRWEGVPEDARAFIENVFAAGNYQQMYQQVQQQERQSQDVLVDFQRQHPGAVSESNVDDILEQLRARKPDDSEG